MNTFQLLQMLKPHESSYYNNSPEIKIQIKLNKNLEVTIPLLDISQTGYYGSGEQSPVILKCSLEDLEK